MITSLRVRTKMDPVELRLAQFLREKRTDLNLRLVQVAMLMKITESMMHRMETGKQHITSAQLLKFSKVLGFSLDEFNEQLEC
jgi:transcriptional regulator with XRE-family HTH domain